MVTIILNIITTSTITIAINSFVFVATIVPAPCVAFATAAEVVPEPFAFFCCGFQVILLRLLNDIFKC